ncbi:acetaldehyde dehydrogenase [Fictibacillus macauensis ZFHKF-1]|uniref:Acetaldehyde dehydrogenase n=1 Tax=Fictibacillus macauensis ZFHKF-1 TaxID=1196324 RepID=I8J335_9BACL|nr:acetaldehyde dehydrogenase (acetylating) [Fictibacillus macauensis]EIT86166.1 acetaldehyde dehydrogenase [Fictibacillus macauensis ZFHKF-1]
MKVALLGSGNIGTDLMYKLLQSDTLQLVAMIGIDETSEGLRRAAEAGVQTYHNGIDALVANPDMAQLIFDATSAQTHREHAPILQSLQKRVIDLTPAALGPFVCPAVSSKEVYNEPSVNMMTCGGQATIPIIAAIGAVTPVSYAEIVATIASRSAGPGTRANIDEFTVTTKKGIEEVGGAAVGKAIILLNPAEPPIFMRNTVYCELDREVDAKVVVAAIHDVVERVQRYVPGYRLRQEPLFDENRVTILLEVEGAGHYFPPYAGNLDIMTAAATMVGEQMARVQGGKHYESSHHAY